jgi:hopanoid biosynthesis associated RND transporter like protein HpnN
LVVVSRTGGLLRRLVRVSCHRPLLTLTLGVSLAVLSVWYAFAQLSFATSTADLLPRGQAYMQRFHEYERVFGEIDDLIIVVEAPSPPEAKVYAGRLVRELRQREVPLRHLTYRIDPKQFEGQALLYLSKQKLTEIRDRIFDYQEFMESFAARPTLDQLVEGLATQIAGAFVTGFLDLGIGDNKKTENDLRFIEDLVAQISARLDRPVPYKSPWGAFFSVDADDSDAGYFLSDDERLLFILAVPKSQVGSFTNDREAIEGVRQVIRDLRPHFPDIQVGVTGKAALSNDEMVSAFSDSEWASILSLALTMGLIFWGFMRIGKPTVMCALLVVGLCWSIGFTTLAIGHLSLFSVMFISIVIGIGIDYGIYFLFRYEEELFLGRTLREALEITAARSGPPILVGAVTAAGTFYVLALTDFRGVQELGIISGSAILLSWLTMMTLLPAALVLIDRRHTERPQVRIPRSVALERIRMPLFERLLQFPRTVLVVAVLLTLLSLWGLRGVGFDYNLLNLQARGTESVVWEKRILATSGRSGFAGLATASSLDELRRKAAAFKKLSTVSEVDSLLMMIPEDQEEKQKLIRDFAPIVAPVRIARSQSIDLPRLLAGLETLKRRLDIAENEAPAGSSKQRLDKLTDDIGRLIRKIRQSDRDAVENALAAFQAPLYRDFVRSFQRLQANLSPKRVGLDQVPTELRNRYHSDAKGLFLIQVHPSVNIWDREGARSFVTELRSVDPEVTGTPIITYEAIRLMERSYQQGTIYALVLVSGVIALTIRRARETLLALLPLGLGMLWTVGLMYFFNLKFTLGNVFGLPLILGSACEYGMNVVVRFLEGRDHGGPLIARSTVMAVLISGLTTVVGFGGLMMASHRGIFGLGLLLTLGSTTSLIAALIVLPVLLRMVQQMRETRRSRREAKVAAAEAVLEEPTVVLEGARRRHGSFPPPPSDDPRA